MKMSKCKTCKFNNGCDFPEHPDGVCSAYTPNPKSQKIKCKNCFVKMTWAANKVQYGRLLKKGFTESAAKEIMPLCNKCTTSYCKGTGQEQYDSMEEIYVEKTKNLRTGQEPDDAAEFNIEKLSELVHKAYCKQYKKVNGKEYWTRGDYSCLDEQTKEYDRVIVRAILGEFFALIAQLQTRCEGLKGIVRPLLEAYCNMAQTISPQEQFTGDQLTQRAKEALTEQTKGKENE